MKRSERVSYNNLLSELYTRKNEYAFKADTSGAKDYYGGMYEATKEAIQLLENIFGKRKGELS